MKRFLYGVTAITLTAQAVAGTMGESRDWHWVGVLSAGPLWANPGATQTFYLTPSIEKTYAARRPANGLGSGELFFGIHKPLPSTLWLRRWRPIKQTGELGLAVATTSNAKLQGEIWDDADQTFNNYNYQYRVRNTRIALKGRLLFDKGYWVTPWVNASLGVGFNRAHNFYNTPLIEEAVLNPNFGDHTQIGFTYTLGLGFQKVLGNHWQAGAGYEFADWGKSALGRASTQTLNTGLTLNHLYTNGVLFNLTYVV